MQREPTSDLYSSFGPRDRLAQLRRLIQDAIDVFEGLVLSHEQRYGSTGETEVRLDEGPAVRVSERAAPAEISLNDVGTPLHAR